MKLNDKISVLVDSFVGKKVSASKKIADEQPGMNQDIENAEESIDLERKPEDYDEKREKFEKKIVHDMNEVTKTDPVEWEKVHSGAILDGYIVVSVKKPDGGAERISVEESKIDDVLMKACINGWVVKKISSTQDAPGWFKVAEGMSEESSGSGDAAFDYLVSLMSNDTGMIIDKAIDETKNVFFKPEGSSVVSSFSLIENEMREVLCTEMISEMEQSGAVFNVGPNRYIKRIYSLFKDGKSNLVGVKVAASDFEGE